MKTSVIVPVFNQERYLSRCLRSLMDQNYDHDLYEIVVVDDGSTDLTHSVIRPFLADPRVRLLRHEKNMGLPAAVNTGCRAALGQYLVRVDADDYVNENFLYVLTLFLNMNDKMDSVACDYLKVNDSEEVLERCSAADTPIACGILFRKDNLFEVGLYDESFLMHEDIEMRERYLKRYSIYNVKLPLYRYRMHAQNMTKNDELDRVFRKKLKEKHG